ncbi:MAG TPA: glycosyltransferase family 2 protein [Burkholderiales bacterium]|nr:glycosyltransferase family 2 protein [Burkholderiales bacterium]
MSAVLPVTVIVPCYRCAATVRRAVASIAGQVSQPAQIVLVDDGSRDGTLDVLRDLQRSYGKGRVDVVALGENHGAASARNAGWKAASGEFLAFLDADDAWHPRKLEIQYAFMRSHPDISLCGHAHARIADGAPLNRPLTDSGYRMVSLAQLLVSNRFITPSVMVRRDVTHRFLEGARHMEDHLLWLEIAAGGARVTRLNETLAFIYKRPFGASGLSAHLVGMEKAELRNYRLLRERGMIGATAMWILQGYSLAKFARRLLIAAFARSES